MARRAVGVGLAGGEVRRREEGGNGVAGGEHLQIVVRQVGAMVDGGTAHLDAEPDPGSKVQLVGMETQTQPCAPPGLEHRPRLIDVESAGLAEHIHPAHMRANGIEHRSAYQLGVVVGPSLVFARYHMGSQESGLGSHLGCKGGGQCFGFDR